VEGVGHDRRLAEAVTELLDEIAPHRDPELVERHADTRDVGFIWHVVVIFIARSGAKCNHHPGDALEIDEINSKRGPDGGRPAVASRRRRLSFVSGS
jgi:hypothetical protein